MPLARVTLLVLAFAVVACGQGSGEPKASSSTGASSTAATAIVTPSATPAGPTATSSDAGVGAVVTMVAVETCVLVRPAELEAIFPGDSFQTEPGADGTCGYIGAHGDATDSVRVTLTRQDAKLFQAIKGNSQGTKDIAGIGDQAYLVQDTATLVRLYLLKEGWAVGITLATSGDSAAARATPVATRVAAIQAVAKAISGRLP